MSYSGGFLGGADCCVAASIPDHLQLLPANAGSICAELRAEFGLLDKSSGLTIDGLQRPTVDLIMVGNGESLGLAGSDTT